MTALSETANQHLRELERVRKEQDAVIKKINKIHSKLCLTDPEKAERFGEKLWVRLRDFYEEAKELATKEDYISGLCIKEVESLSHSAVAPPPPPPAPPPPPPPPPPSAPPPSTLPLPLPASAQPSSVNQQPSSLHHHPQQPNSQSSRKKSASAMMAGNTSMAANPSTASKRKKLKMVAPAGGGGGGGGGGEMGETVMISGTGVVISRLGSPSVSPRVTAVTSTQNYHPQHYHPQQHQHQHQHHHHHHQQQQQQQQQHHQQQQQPPSSASMEQTSAIAVGDQVAARVTGDDAEKDDWIVVKVTKYDRESNRYEVIDEEPGDDEESGQRKYKLGASCIIPFPKKGDQNQTAEFYAGAQVLAVYPGTTALYKAAVVRKRKGDDYLLEFDDDEEEGVDGLPQRSVPFYHTVPLPEGHRQ